jgi:hypothetical protein
VLLLESMALFRAVAAACLDLAFLWALACCSSEVGRNWGRFPAKFFHSWGAFQCVNSSSVLRFQEPGLQPLLAPSSWPPAPAISRLTHRNLAKWTPALSSLTAALQRQASHHTTLVNSLTMSAFSMRDLMPYSEA